MGFSTSLGLLQRNGADIDKFMDILRGSALYAPTFDKKLQRMLDRDYANPNFPTKVRCKSCHLHFNLGFGFLTLLHLVCPCMTFTSHCHAWGSLKHKLCSDSCHSASKMEAINTSNAAIENTLIVSCASHRVTLACVVTPSVTAISMTSCD